MLITFFFFAVGILKSKLRYTSFKMYALKEFENMLTTVHTVPRLDRLA